MYEHIGRNGAGEKVGCILDVSETERCLSLLKKKLRTLGVEGQLCHLQNGILARGKLC